MRPRPRPSMRWNRIFPGGERVLEYRCRAGGACVGCGLETQWAWFGSCEDFMLGIGLRARHGGGSLAWFLRVPGVEPDGRVTCYDCRQRTAAGRRAR